MSTALKPRTSDPDTGNGDIVAHIVPKATLTDAYVFGFEVEALCGYRWIPTRDPEGKPVCQACVAELERRRSI